MWKILCKIIKSYLRLTKKLGFLFRAKYYSNIFISAGKSMRINQGVILSCPENISCGDCLRLNPQVYIIGKGGVEFGDNVIVSAGAKILSSALDFEKGCSQRKHIHKKVKIGSNVWIGAGAIILPGVTIGNNVICAAGSVVTKNLADNFIYAGVPAKPIRPIATTDSVENV